MNILRFDRGASAVEFALIVPFLIVLCGGILEMTNLYFVRSQLNEIARDATRRLALDALTIDETKTFIAKKLAQTTEAEGQIVVNEHAESGEDIKDVTVSVAVPINDILIFDFVSGLFSGTDGQLPDLSVAVTMFKH